ncbi:hypothetical protein [Paenibacillus sp. YIM B09110]|uniref:hypothetical protein n=1 Tax=Paenibacillus sp. YIM B09110 TaxID=3126102 RepID=UPI00301C9B01
MTRMYEDDASEIASLTAWIERRLNVAGMFTLRYFSMMWRRSFGSTENMPAELREKIDARVAELRKEARNESE